MMDSLEGYPFRGTLGLLADALLGRCMVESRLPTHEELIGLEKDAIRSFLGRLKSEIGTLAQGNGT